MKTFILKKLLNLVFLVAIALAIYFVYYNNSIAPVAQVKKSSMCVKNILNMGFYDGGCSDNPPSLRFFDDAKAWCHTQEIRKEEGIKTHKFNMNTPLL